MNRILYGGGHSQHEDQTRVRLRAYATELRTAFYDRGESSAMFAPEWLLAQIIRLEEEKARTRYKTLMDIMRTAPAPAGDESHKAHLLEWSSQVNLNNMEQLNVMSQHIGEHCLLWFSEETRAAGTARDKQICQQYDARIQPLMEAHGITPNAFNEWWGCRDHAPLAQMGPAKEK